MGFLSSLFGVKDRTPKTETVIQAQKLPEEISPFVKEILKEAKDLFEADKARGYDPYTGETIAPLTPEEEAAMAGIAGLAGTTQPFLEEAVETYRTGAEKFTPEAAEEYMSPYQRAVTDIEKREAQRQFEKNVMPRFEAEAISAGGLSGLGTRAGVEAAELQRGQSQLLADIEAKGLQSAYQDARLGFEQQKAREQQMAANIGRTGPAMFQAGLAEQGALQTVGEQKRQLGQSALDEAYYRFLEEQQFPQRTLAQYSGTVYGNPLAGMPTATTTTTGLPGAPSMGQQLLGMGLSGLNIYGMGGGFGGGFSGQTLANRMYGKAAAEGGSVNEVIHRRTPGPLTLPNRPSQTITENIRVLQESLSRTTDPNERREIMDKINIQKQDPSLKIGRPSERFQATREALTDVTDTAITGAGEVKKSKIKSAGDLAKASERGISGVENILKKAASDRGVTVDQLKSELAEARKGIAGPGIMGISEAMKEATPALAFTKVVDKTRGGVRQASIDEADRRTKNIELLKRLRLANIDKEAEGGVKVAEKRLAAGEKEAGTVAEAEVTEVSATWEAKKNKLGKEHAARLKGIEEQFNLQDEIAGWDEKSQIKLIDLASKRLSVKKLKAEIKKLKAEADAESKQGEMKPAKYNALAKTAGVTSGIIFDKETQSISKGGKPIDAQGALDYVDTMIKIVKEQPGSANWVTALDAAAKKAARKLTKSLNIPVATIEQTILITDPQHRKNAIKQIAANTKATEENLRQILGYYGTN